MRNFGDDGKSMTYILGATKPRTWRQLNATDYFLLALLNIGVFFILYRLLQMDRLTLDFSSILPYIVYVNDSGQYVGGILLDGLLTTLRLGFWSLVLALIVGSLVGVISAHKKGFASLPAKIYVQLIRNTPPLILLFLVFFFASYVFTEPLLQFEFYLSKSPAWVQSLFYNIIAPKGKLDIMFAAILTLGLYEGAYVAEIVRGGIESIPRAQWEAARSQGLTLWQTRRLVIIPQTFRLILPPLVGESICTFKNSALASIISLPELIFQSTEIMAVSNITLELWIFVAFLYYIISYALEHIGWKLEKRAKWYN